MSHERNGIMLTGHAFERMTHQHDATTLFMQNPFISYDSALRDKPLGIM